MIKYNLCENNQIQCDNNCQACAQRIYNSYIKNEIANDEQKLLEYQLIELVKESANNFYTKATPSQRVKDKGSSKGVEKLFCKQPLSIKDLKDIIEYIYRNNHWGEN